MTLETSLSKSRDVDLYVDYNDARQRRSLDVDVYDAAKATVFPAVDDPNDPAPTLFPSGVRSVEPDNLYVGEPQPVADYICGARAPRSLATHYIIDRERRQHPAHFSRFGYARAFYGYVSGHFPGRYQENDYCQKFELPKDMAPERFYHPPNVGPFSVASTAYIGSKAAREAWPRWAV